MTTDQTGAEQQVWGAPQPAPKRWGWRESAAAVAVAAVIAALGGAAIYAAAAGSSHSFGAPHQAFGPGGGPPGGPGGQHGAIGGPGPADVGATSLHGEFVVPDGPGRYTTVLTQTGTVTAISPSSLTVRSEDGFSQAYVIPSTAGNAGPPFAVDDHVVVRATRNGQIATVTNIGNPRQDGPMGPGGPGGPPRHN
ncbi:MAG TPA: hypothetical protein VL634_02105 [Mycobacterium sp.]|nr:hypothetical protein [Mycobacterium sp.]